MSRRELSIDVAEHRSILKNKGVTRILVIFQDRPVQPYHLKGLGESFPLIRLNIGLSKLKNYQITHNRRLSYPKQVAFPKTGVLLYYLWL